ncbi:MAG: peptidoglycan DD-metalloendopeptidase family protein [Alphaproteobacteria bacterium]|nr:peptidoglycan DD-metalloendopeptidase family protein [Alphaproteobacteria bacterium]
MKFVSKAWTAKACLGFGALCAASVPLARQAEATLPTAQQLQASYAQAAQALPPVVVERTLTLQRGQTLVQHLKQAGFSPAQVAALTEANQAARLPVAAKTTLTLSYEEAAPYQIGVARMAFRPTPTQEVALSLKGNHATAVAKEKPLKEHRAVAVGRIEGSLWADATRAGLSPQQIKEFMDIFAWDLDYTRDIHPGDTFKVTYEETQNDLGQRVKTGRILAAAFTVGGETRQAFWWPGTNEYLNEKGESKRKLLLRTPLEVYRISSGFGLRTHPVLGFSKLHTGTDFAAPIGTPVKASGDGVITFIGPKGPNGNLIRIRHNEKFSTAYAHLHRFTKGLKVGSRVRQGQIIAQVGNTGRSTGPHLHYEVQIHGQSVNPMRADLPTSNPLSRKQLAQFKATVAAVQVAWRAALGNERVASR